MITEKEMRKCKKMISSGLDSDILLANEIYINRMTDKQREMILKKIRQSRPQEYWIIEGTKLIRLAVQGQLF